jgi:hypothetical protein
MHSICCARLQAVTPCGGWTSPGSSSMPMPATTYAVAPPLRANVSVLKVWGRRLWARVMPFIPFSPHAACLAAEVHCLLSLLPSQPHGHACHSSAPPTRPVAPPSPQRCTAMAAAVVQCLQGPPAQGWCSTGRPLMMLHSGDTDFTSSWNVLCPVVVAADLYGRPWGPLMLARRPLPSQHRPSLATCWSGGCTCCLRCCVRCPLSNRRTPVMSSMGPPAVGQTHAWLLLW